MKYIFFFWIFENVCATIKVLNRSPLIINLLQGTTQDMNFVVNGNTYLKYYLFSHVIYPQWNIFVQTIDELQDKKKQHFF